MKNKIGAIIEGLSTIHESNTVKRNLVISSMTARDARDFGDCWKLPTQKGLLAVDDNDGSIMVSLVGCEGASFDGIGLCVWVDNEKEYNRYSTTFEYEDEVEAVRVFKEVVKALNNGMSVKDLAKKYKLYS